MKQIKDSACMNPKTLDLELLLQMLAIEKLFRFTLHVAQGGWPSDYALNSQGKGHPV